MAKAKRSTVKRAKGAAKRGAKAVKRSGRKAKGIVRRAAKRVAGAFKRVVKRVRGAAKRSAPKRRKSLPPRGGAAGGMVVYAVNPDGSFTAPPSSKRGGVAKGRKSKGSFPNLRGSGSGKGMQMLTLGGAFIVGGAAGFKLYSQDPVPVPFTEKSIKRSTILLIVAGAVAVGARKRYPKVAKHSAALAAGTAVGIGGAYAAARSAESSV